MEDNRKRKSLYEKVTYPGVAFSHNYFPYAMNAIDEDMEKYPERTYYDMLKSIVFARLIFEYYFLFIPFYTLLTLFILIGGIVLQIFHIIFFTKLKIFYRIYLVLLRIPISLELFRIKKEFQAEFISFNEYTYTVNKELDRFDKEVRAFDRN